jgi:outer membrane protein assembly factor BamB
VSGSVVALRPDSGRIIWSRPVNVARGSVVVWQGLVLAATRDPGFVVLDAATGHLVCRQKLPAESDRAGLTIAGRTGILTFLNGMVAARDMREWSTCHAAFPGVNGP